MKKPIIKRMAKPIMVNRIIAAAAVDENLSGSWTATRSPQNSRNSQKAVIRTDFLAGHLPSGWGEFGLALDISRQSVRRTA